jgi:hypothetical protein
MLRHSPVAVVVVVAGMLGFVDRGLVGLDLGRLGAGSRGRGIGGIGSSGLEEEMLVGRVDVRVEYIASLM